MKLSHPIIALAPMDGYTDSAFRQVCKSVNPDLLLFTEFVAADGLHHKALKLQKKLAFADAEKPIIAQIFGKHPETFITAARYCEQAGFSGIDINMGCPAKKVVKSEHGVALRKKPDLAFKLVETLVQATSLPVSVKTRLGWNSADDLVAFGKGIESAGARMLTVHGRTYAQGYAETADWNPLYELKKHVSLPVIGNGDVQSFSEIPGRLHNLDGVMIGRAAIGNPWVFTADSPLTFQEKIPLIRRHADLLWEAKGENVAPFEIRKHLVAYVKGFPDASRFRSKLVSVTSREEIYAILKEIAEQTDDRRTTPST